MTERPHLGSCQPPPVEPMLGERLAPIEHFIRKRPSMILPPHDFTHSSSILSHMILPFSFSRLAPGGSLTASATSLLASFHFPPTAEDLRHPLPRPFPPSMIHDPRSPTGLSHLFRYALSPTVALRASDFAPAFAEATAGKQGFRRRPAAVALRAMAAKPGHGGQDVGPDGGQASAPTIFYPLSTIHDPLSSSSRLSRDA